MMRRSIVAGAIVLFGLAWIARPAAEPVVAQKPTGDEPRPTVGGLSKAEALLLIVGDPLGLPAPPTGESMPARLGSLISAWSQRAGEPGEFQGCFVDITPLSVCPEGDTLAIMKVTGRDDVDKALALAQRRLQEVLSEVHRSRLEPLNHKVNRASERVDRAEATIAGVAENLQRLREESRSQHVALEPQDPQLLASVRRDHLAMRAELAGLHARREATVEQIAVAKNKLDDAQGQQRAVFDELEVVLKVKEDELARVHTLFEKGLVSQAELAKAEVALVQAKADLVDRRRALVSEAGGGLLGRLNEQLIDVQIAITTTEARLKETDKALEDLESSAYNPVNSVVIEYQRARRALENAWAEQEGAAADLAKLQRTLEAMPAPKVIVIGGGEKPK